jgi:hypothetical protein
MPFGFSMMLGHRVSEAGSPRALTVKVSCSPLDQRSGRVQVLALEPLRLLLRLRDALLEVAKNGGKWAGRKRGQTLAPHFRRLDFAPDFGHSLLQQRPYERQ